MALTTQTGSAGLPIPWKYDVFLSFRGLDTRGGITDHLYNKLIWHGFSTFRDDPRLEKGTVISPELLAAIEQSKFAVVVLSENYATSTWCLRELSKIVQCMEERGTILPVFYKVEPSDVRHQRGGFAEAFVKHEEELGKGDMEVKGWRDALTKVANLAGWDSKNYMYETDLIRDIVQKLWSIVRPSLTLFGSSEKLVGMDTKVKKMEVLLDKEANDVRFIGIWGMGGLGKTTLAKLVYEKISHQFEVCIFLADVREVSSTTQGLIYLQKQIISQTLKEENGQVCNVYNGITMIKRCCSNKAVLLVLDDVDQSKQLENLAGKEDWFGSRSRIIITTRDQRVLVRRVENPYELKGLNENEALELFSWNAFWKDEPEEDYAEQSKSFVRYAGGLPLALKTLGSLLYKRCPDAWNSALAKLQNTPDRTIFDLLKVSYDGLDEKEKETFLDITCFSWRFGAKFIIELLYSSDVCNRIAIDVLVEKSLLTITSHNEIGIHDLIRDMGCEIYRRESHKEPGRRSRLWLHDDIFHVFTQNTGTEAVEGIMLHLDKLEDGEWNPEALSKMHKLRLLYIDNLRLSHGPEHLPNALRFLKWSWYPSESLPPCFQPDELTELSLVYSNIHHLWNEKKNLDKLKSIDLSYSMNLTSTPDFTGIPSLEKLILEGCTSLVEIHPSIAMLKRLRIWNFRNCESIESLPSKVNMEFLETFDVSGCSKLKMIPDFTGIQNLEKLILEGCTNLVEIHPSIALLKRIRIWNFRNCASIESLPSEVNMEFLETFDVSGCSKLKMIPEFVGQMKRLSKLYLGGTDVGNLSSSLEHLHVNLMELDLSEGVIREQPHPLIPRFASLKHCSSLTTLQLNNCNICEGDIPDDIGFLSSLECLELQGNNFVSLPRSIHLLSKLRLINVEDCKRLQQFPELPVSDALFVNADNCTSLRVYPELPDLCRFKEFRLSCINCFSKVDNQDASYFLCSVLERLIEKILWSFNYIQFAIRGSEIPKWFSNPSVGDSVTVKLPVDAYNFTKLMGFAVCALIEPQENQLAVPVLFKFCWYGPHGTGTRLLGGFRFAVSPGFSDHLILVVVPISHWVGKGIEVKFVFQSSSLFGNNGCMKVTQCGARALLYKHDMEELISRMNQSKSRFSVYEATDEHEGAMVKATTSTGGGSDDDYYSAEE